MHLHPLMGGSFRNWIRLLLINGEVDRQYIPKAIVTSLVSLTGCPGRAIERLVFDATIASTEISSPPIFVIGHWRSGTTYLHNLLSQDPRFAYPSYQQVCCPELFMGSSYIIRPIAERLLPAQRPMDEVNVGLDAPQEEEFALGSLSDYSFYNGLFFPKRIQHYFRQYVLFEAGQSVESEWKTLYLKFLKKLTLANRHRTLLLKNPTNTARIKTLLTLFPQAKFIHIYRNPYEVFLSTQNLYRKLLPIFGFQNLSEAEIEANTLLLYRLLMQRYLVERCFIPASNLIEVKYEDFEADPLGELSKIYDVFNLTGFDQVEPSFKRYVSTQISYRKNRYTLSPAAIAAVNQHWQFALEQWKYGLPETVSP